MSIVGTAQIRAGAQNVTPGTRDRTVTVTNVVRHICPGVECVLANTNAAFARTVII